MKHQKWIAGLLVLVLCLSLSVSAFAADAALLDPAQIAAAAAASDASGEGASVDLALDPELLETLGVELTMEDGVLTVSLGGLLALLGATMEFDEATGILTVTDESGILTALLDLLAK